MSPEPFVSAKVAAQFLSVSRRYLLVLARRGIAGAYCTGTGRVRRFWIFRLSELAAAIQPIQKTSEMRYDPKGSLHAEKRH
jgi:hypothetical protein